MHHARILLCGVRESRERNGTVGYSFPIETIRPISTRQSPLFYPLVRITSRSLHALREAAPLVSVSRVKRTDSFGKQRVTAIPTSRIALITFELHLAEITPGLAAQTAIFYRHVELSRVE